MNTHIAQILASLSDVKYELAQLEQEHMSLVASLKTNYLALPPDQRDEARSEIEQRLDDSEVEEFFLSVSGD